MKARDVPFEIRKLTRLQLQEGLLKMRRESRDARSALGECERLRHSALETTTKLSAALEAIALIAACRSQRATDEWSLVEDVARNAIRKAAL